MFEDAFCTEIDVRKLQKNYAVVVCRYSLKFCKKNVICSNAAQKLLVYRIVRAVSLTIVQIGTKV